MVDLILIDFSWLYNKYYFVAKVKPLQTSTSPEALKPQVHDMLLQFLSLVAKNYGNSRVLLVLDSPLSTTANAALCVEYKRNRDTEGKKEVYKYFKDIVGKLSQELSKNILFVRAKGFEADQAIAYLAEKNKDNKEIIIFSGDKDLLQLSCYENVDISDKYEKGRFLVKSDKEIFEKFKNSKNEDFTRISTNKKDILKYRSLKGDVSDNLSPVFPRIKDKEIAQIIKDYWIDNQEEGLSSERADKILEDLDHDNPVLAQKLREAKDVWLRNYKIMNLFGLQGLTIKRIKKSG